MNNILVTLKNLGTWRLTSIIGGGVVVLAIMIYLATRFTTTPMEMLFGNLELADTNAIVSKLQAEKVSYELRHDGTEIWVPQDRKMALRVKMAEQHIPNEGTVTGYELFDKGDMLGSTSFVQNVNLMRAMEGELARTILSIEGIKTARVHLVLPKREVFSRETQEPSASIALRLAPKQRLSQLQVQAIQHLVAASVPKLQPGHVSIIDERGGLLTRGSEDETSVMVQQVSELKMATEQRLKGRIEELLEKSLGADKVRANVAVEMDMDHIATTKEIIDPESKVERSHQTNEENEQQLDSENSSVSVSQNLPDAGTTNNPGARSQSKTSRASETVNYEFSKTTTNQIRDTAAIKRITAAVLVDGNYGPPGEGEKKLTYIPLDEKRIEQMKTLVQNAIGYDPKRGDQVEVSNMPFAGHDEPEDVQGSSNLMGINIDFIEKSASNVGLAVVAILFLLFVIRPIISRAIESFAFQTIPPEVQSLLPSAQTLSATGAISGSSTGETNKIVDSSDALDELIDIDKVEGRVKASSIRKINDIVDKHPEAAVSIIRYWMYADD